MSSISTYFYSFFILLICVQSSISQCDVADDCMDISQILMPETNDDFTFNFLCVNACLDTSTPESSLPPGVNCRFDEFPSIWYKIELDDLAEQIFIAADAIGWQPVWALYSGNTCDDLVQLDQSNSAAPACSNMDNTPDLSQDALLNGSKSYYLLVTADRPVDQLLSTDFDLCVSTTITPFICNGQNDDNCFISDSNYQIIDREFPGDLNGPFLPGEEVTLCFEYFYDSSNSGADWMNGLIPSFGENWDRSFFDPSSVIVGQGQWLETDGNCGAIIQENVSHICTYTNDNGELTLCNTLCQACPCETGMQEGDPLPSGWFWVTNGGSAGCENDCSPGEGWGSGSTSLQLAMCMNLRVKAQPDYSNLLGLQISMNTFSDGVAGCWEDPMGECVIDKPIISPLWELENCQETALDDLVVMEMETCQDDELICYGQLLTFVTDNFPDGTEFLWNLSNEEDVEFFSQDLPTLSFNIYEEGQINLSLKAKYNCQIVIYDTTFIVEPPIQLDSLVLEACSDLVIDVNPQNYIGYEGDVDPFQTITSEVDTTYEVTIFTEDTCGCRSNQFLEIFMYVPKEFYDTVSVASEPFELVYIDTVLTSLGDHIVTLEAFADQYCDTTIFVTVELSSGIGELETYYSVIYPNPATDYLHLQLSGVRLKNIQVFNVSGIEFELNVQNGYVNIQGLPSGIYLVKLEFENGKTEYHKIIKL